MDKVWGRCTHINKNTQFPRSKKKHSVTFFTSPYPTIYAKLSSAEGKKKRKKLAVGYFVSQTHGDNYKESLHLPVNRFRFLRGMEHGRAKVHSRFLQFCDLQMELAAILTRLKMHSFFYSRHKRHPPQIPTTTSIDAMWNPRKRPFRL